MKTIEEIKKEILKIKKQYEQQEEDIPEEFESLEDSEEWHFCEGCLYIIGKVLKIIDDEQTTPKYTVEIEQTGDILAEFETLEDAEKCIKEYERQDKADGNYSERFYSIYRIDGEQRELVWNY